MIIPIKAIEGQFSNGLKGLFDPNPPNIIEESIDPHFIHSKGIDVSKMIAHKLISRLATEVVGSWFCNHPDSDVLCIEKHFEISQIDWNKINFRVSMKQTIVPRVPHNLVYIPVPSMAFVATKQSEESAIKRAMPKDVYKCKYCHGYTKNDTHGNCVNCGAERESYE